MNKQQAETAAEALLSPHIKQQQEDRKARETRIAKWALIAKKQRPYCLGGSSIGALLGHFLLDDLFAGFVYGSAAGMVIGSIFVRVRNSDVQKSLVAHEDS